MGFLDRILNVTGELIGLGRKDIIKNRFTKIYFKNRHSSIGNFSENRIKELHNNALMAAFIDWHDSKYKPRSRNETIIELAPFLVYDNISSRDALFTYICILDSGEASSEYYWNEFLEFINDSVSLYPEKSLPGIINNFTWVKFIKQDIINSIAEKNPEVKKAQQNSIDIANLILKNDKEELNVHFINNNINNFLSTIYEEDFFFNNSIPEFTNIKPQKNLISFFNYFSYLRNNEIPPFSWEKVLEVNHFNEIENYMTPIIYAFSANKSHNLNLTNKQLNDLIFWSDLKFQPNTEYESGQNALMCAFKYNKKENLNISNLQFSFLIRNSDLKQFTHKWDEVPEHRQDLLKLHNDDGGYYGVGDSGLGQNALFLAFMNNKNQNLNIPYNQFKYLIANSDYKHYDDNTQNAFLYASEYFNSQHIPLDNLLWDSLIENSNIQTIYYYHIIATILDPDFENKTNTFTSFTEIQWKKIIEKLEKDPKIYQNTWKNINFFEILSKNRTIIGLSHSDLNSLSFTKKLIVK